MKNTACIDFTEDYYPSPNINKLDDATTEFEYLSFLDAMSGYH